MTPRDELREAVARKICGAELISLLDVSVEAYKKAVDEEWPDYLQHADAALSAIEREHVIVPLNDQQRGKP